MALLIIGKTLNSGDRIGRGICWRQETWASEQTSVVELVKPEAVLAKLVYAIAKPVSSHLVDKVHHWLGVESLTAIDQNLPLVATKPLIFFDQNNKDLPELIELRFDRAPGFEPLSHEECAKLRAPETIRGGFARAGVRPLRGIRGLTGTFFRLKPHRPPLAGLVSPLPLPATPCHGGVNLGAGFCIRLSFVGLCPRS